MQSKSISVDFRYHPILAGRQRAFFQNLMIKSGAHIYTALQILTDNAKPDANQSLIYITGFADSVAKLESNILDRLRIIVKLHLHRCLLL